MRIQSTRISQLRSKLDQFRNCYPLNATDQFVPLKNTLFHFLYSNYSLAFATLDARFANIEYMVGNRTTFFQPTWPEIYETRYPLDSEIFQRSTIRLAIKYFETSLTISLVSSRSWVGRGRNVPDIFLSSHVFVYWTIRHRNC